MFLKSGLVDAYVHDRILVDDQLLARVQQLAPIATEAGLSMSQLALAWCLYPKNVASVIVGASRPEQVTDNAAAAGKRLTPDVLLRIDNVLAGVG
jgi:aryl-alcohol dehydrogenase-like predicted oxidoreductase